VSMQAEAENIAPATAPAHRRETLGRRTRGAGDV
jgi:hypothetical protein